jgi:plasmid stabilization system protein ParE
MNFRVIWTRAARDQLADIWLSHPDRAAVTAAAHRIDQLLGRDPANQGEGRPNNRRIMFESPLVVIYRIDPANNRVIVSNVRQY